MEKRNRGKKMGLFWGWNRLAALLCCMVVIPVLPVCAAETGKGPLTLLSPSVETTTVAMRPVISFQSAVVLDKKTLLVLLDNQDVSALVVEKEGVYRYRPAQAVVSGVHTLYISAYGNDGTEIEQEFSFTTRQSEMFEEVYSNNRLSVTMKGLLNQSRKGGTPPGGGGNAQDEDSEGFSDSPDVSVDAALASESGVREGRWKNTLRANLRYFEQNKKLGQSQEKGLNLVNFLLSSRYGGEHDALLVELGDTTVTGSANTFASLSRRGVRAELTWKDFVLQGFGVLGAEKLSQGKSSDETGLGFDGDDHIMGATLRGSFLDGRLRAGLLYINGGQKENSFGQWHQNSEVRRGDVSGVVLGGDFFDGKLSVEGEYDIATFDYETLTPGEVEQKEDTAYRIQAGGSAGLYQYTFAYKYFGPYYQVVGSQSMRDWAGFELSASRNGERHSVQFFSSYSHDNVEDDPLYATLYSLSAGMGWNYSGWEKFPVGLRVEYTSQQSEDEPAGSQETSTRTGTISGDISYLAEQWSVSLMTSYSEQDDRTPANYDSRLFSLTCSPSYTTERFSVMASLGYNGSWDLNSDVRTDTNTLSLDARTSFLNQALALETGGTYDITSTDDRSIETSNLSLHVRMSYAIDKLWKFENSTLALECTHNYREDEISDTTMENTVITLVLSSALPFSL